ncbi:MAG: hypothetical protein AAGK04_00275 [Planctomycetota bacterium]
MRLCVVCKQDCSGRPRVKDKRGRYLCEHAFGAMKAAKRDGLKPDAEVIMCAEALEGSAGGKPAASGPVGGPVDGEPTRLPEDDGMIGLADDDAQMDLGSLAALERSAEGAVGEAQSGSACPKCGAFIAMNAVICTSCGFNAETGRGAKTLVGKEVDQEVKGKKRRKKDPAEMSERERADWETSRDVVRKAYMVPILIFLVCAGLSMAIYAMIQPDAPGLAVMGYLLGFAIEAPFTIAAFYVCAALFVGSDAPFRLDLVRMLAVIAGSGLAEAIGYALDNAVYGLGMLFVLVPWFVYIAMIVTLMEMEFIDAFIVGVVSGFMKFMAGVLVLWVALRIGLPMLTAGTLVGPAGPSRFDPRPQDSPGRFVDNDWDGLDDHSYHTKAEFRLWRNDGALDADTASDFYDPASGVFLDYDGDDLDDRTGRTPQAIAQAAGVELHGLIGYWDEDAAWYQAAIEALQAEWLEDAPSGVDDSDHTPPAPDN